LPKVAEFANDFMAATASKSKLYALRSELSEWRSAGKSHAEIAELLQTEKGIKVASSTVFEFLKSLEKSSEPEADDPPGVPAEIQEQLARIESGLEAIRASLALANSTEPPPAPPDPGAGIAQIEKAIDKLAASLADTLQAVDQTAAARHEALSKILASLPSQTEQASSKMEPTRLPQMTIPKGHVGRIWLRAVALTSLFWLLIWQLMK
jgi:hypothetical protein